MFGVNCQGTRAEWACPQSLAPLHQPRRRDLEQAGKRSDNSFFTAAMPDSRLQSPLDPDQSPKHLRIQKSNPFLNENSTIT